MKLTESKSNRLKILNIWVDNVTPEQAKERVIQILKYGQRPYSVFASNPEKNFSITKDESLYTAYKNADLIIPDGIGIVFATRLLYGEKTRRIPGVEFMKTICSIAAEENKTVFIFGSTDQVNKKAVSVLSSSIRNLRISGRSHGYIKKESMPSLIKKINNSGAEILFLALGSPRQEKWYAINKNEFTNIKLCQGIGGTLDTIAGNVKRAPEFWCRNNLEWFYRLIKEPKRVKRQKVLPLFSLLIILEWIKMKAYRF